MRWRRRLRRRRGGDARHRCKGKKAAAGAPAQPTAVEITWTLANGDKYVGQYKDGKMHGKGTYTQTNGNKYVGEMFENDFHGQGTKTFADGTVQKGRFEHDEFMG